MIDIHLHILPGVDDGPETLQQTLLLAQSLVQDGVHSAIATPHYNDEFPRLSASEVRERVYDVQQMLDRLNIALHLYPGHEALIKPGLLEDIQTGRLATLNNSRYLLLELWTTTWLPETERVIFELLANGIIPILAHPERYHAIQQNPSRLIPLLRQGVLTQITLSSLIGAQGKITRRCAAVLLKKGLVSCIATDAHGMQKRRPHIGPGLQCAAQVLDRNQIYHLIETQPGAIIKNEIYKPVTLQQQSNPFGRRKE